MNKKLNSAVVAASILATNPSQSKMNIGQTPTLPSGFAMTVPVSEIDFFEDNPRHIHDPEIYLQIKESIRATGVQHSVHITKRPNAERYVLAHGGNTRLKIVKELFEETGDAGLPKYHVSMSNISQKAISCFRMSLRTNCAQICIFGIKPLCTPKAKRSWNRNMVKFSGCVCWKKNWLKKVSRFLSPNSVHIFRI